MRQKLEVVQKKKGLVKEIKKVACSSDGQIGSLSK